MSFLNALTNAQRATLREPYSSKVYLALCPCQVVFRAQVNQTTFGKSFASVNYHNVTLGSASAVRVGQTVYIGVGTEIEDAVFVGRVRKAPTSTTLFINETSAALANAMTITVIDEYRVWERLQRATSANARFKDWDQPFQQIAPTIRGLQSSYVLATTSSSAQLALSPQADTHVPNATIASWQWEVADGSFIVGNASSQNVTVSFPQGHRWVRLTVTDSGGRSTFFAFEVYVGDPDTASWCERGVRGVSVSADLDEGYRASIELVREREIIKGQRATLFTVERRGSATSALYTNINIVGYLRDERQSASPDATHSVMRSASFALEGFGAVLGRLTLPGLSILDTQTPTQWGEVKLPTPKRAVAYALLYHTTLANLASIEFGANDDDYILPDLSIEAEAALDALKGIYAQIQGGLSWASWGAIRFSRHAATRTTSERSALVTVATLQSEDVLDAQIERALEARVGQMLAGFGVYDTSQGVVRVITGKAPAEASLTGYEAQTLNAQILRANQSIANARAEAGRRVADALALANLDTRAILTLRDGWWWATPQLDAWWKLDIGDRASLVFALLPSWRWLLESVEYAINNETGRREVRVGLARETQGGSSQSVTALVPQVGELVNPALPSAPDYLFIPPNPLINYPTNAPTKRSRQAILPSDIGLTLPIDPNAYERLRDPGCRSYTILANNTASVSSGFVLQSGEVYTIVVRGRGVVGEVSGTWEQEFDFTTSQHGWIVVTSVCGPGQEQGEWVAGGGWKARTYKRPNLCVFDRTSLGITRLTTTTSTITRVEIDYQSAVNVSDQFLRLYATTSTTGDDEPNIVPPSTVFSEYNPPSNSGTYIWEGSKAMTVPGLRLRWTTRSFGAGGGVTISRIKFEGTGVNPFTGAGKPFHADAFYYNIDTDPATPWANAGGFYINSTPALPTPPEPYNENGEYVFTRLGAGAIVTFKYNLPSFVFNRKPVPFFITVCGPGAGI